MHFPKFILLFLTAFLPTIFATVLLSPTPTAKLALDKRQDGLPIQTDAPVAVEPGAARPTVTRTRYRTRTRQRLLATTMEVGALELNTISSITPSVAFVSAAAAPTVTSTPGEGNDDSGNAEGLDRDGRARLRTENISGAGLEKGISISVLGAAILAGLIANVVR